MVSDQTTYPSVAGKPFFSGTSMNAPHTPQKRVVTTANTSQTFDSTVGLLGSRGAAGAGVALDHLADVEADELPGLPGDSPVPDRAVRAGQVLAQQGQRGGVGLEVRQEAGESGLHLGLVASSSGCGR